MVLTSIVALAASGITMAAVATPSASAGTGSVSTPIGALEMTLDGGDFTEECTDFGYSVVVTGATSDVQWSAEIAAERDGGGSASGMITDFGSGTFADDLMICSGDGAGSWTATVRVNMRDTTDTTAVYNRTMTLDFTISKAESVATISTVNVGSSKTKVKGTVIDTNGNTDTTMFGDVTVKTKKPGHSWKNHGTGQVGEDGSFTVTITKTYPEGTKFKVVFDGTDEAKSDTSAVFEI